MKDFLLEIGCEELPPKALPKLIQCLTHEIVSGLEKNELSFAEVQKYATPRRLGILVSQLSTQQPTRTIERKGPALAAAFDEHGQPTKACLGFAKSCSVDVSELKTRETDKGAWLYFEGVAKAKKAVEILPEIVRQAISRLPIPKPMRWSNQSHEFARPVHWLVMLLGQDIVPATLLGIESSNLTYGHRFHHPQAIEIDRPSSYSKSLQDAYVIADFDKRKQQIASRVDELAKEFNAQAIIPEELLNEVTALVEWPVALIAKFEKDFLNVPKEALVAAMQGHQKSFALQDSQGKLLSLFITVSNIDSKRPSSVVLGNEKVMRARLSDAKFFYNQDKQSRLDSRIERLKSVVFQKKLGTLYDKSKRVEQLSLTISQYLGVKSDSIQRASQLSKCDLMTDMVGEFPELQGTMGYYYAKHDGESEQVCTALKEQYYPRFAKDILPDTMEGCVLALAERLDSLVGIFGINQQPTGEKDPFKCRRMALAIIRILTEKQYDIDIPKILSIAVEQYQSLDNENVINDVMQFVLDRLKVYYHDKGIGQDVIASVLSQQSSRLWDFKLRVDAVNQFKKLEQSRELSAANKRVNKILTNNKVEQLVSNVQTQYLKLDAELLLAKMIEDQEKKIAPLYESAKYTEALTQLASLHQPINHFFEEVMVMDNDENLRNNRLALLWRLRTLFLKVADISLLQKSEKDA